MGRDCQKQTYQSRLAPTPSGHLHLGNLLNFVKTWTMTKKEKGKLLLRIDDYDLPRCKDEYIHHIFDMLNWLDISYDEGPEDFDDFKKNYSSQLKQEYYRKKLASLPGLYQCICSRKEISKTSSFGIYTGTCLPLNLPYKKSQTNTRINIKGNPTLSLPEKNVNLKTAVGDFVLWRKDDLPSSTFAGLIDDIDSDINLFVRGVDLLQVSACQIYLAQQLKTEVYHNSTFHHHELIVGKHGEKLSKGSGSYSLKDLKLAGTTKEQIFQMIAPYMGKSVDEVSTISDFL
jgi:glutamyl/glutaminyl-tRNA synthetase